MVFDIYLGLIVLLWGHRILKTFPLQYKFWKIKYDKSNKS